MVDTETVFQLTFSSVYNNLPYHVHTSDREKMINFMKQHTFDCDTANVDIVYLSNDGENIDDRCEIKTYKMTSNKNRNKIYNVLSTEQLISDALETICSTLSESLLFGEPTTRTDIDFIRDICDLISDLPHSIVLDHMLLNEDESDFLSSDWKRYAKTFGYDRYVTVDQWDGSSIDDSYIYESIQNCYTESGVLPITIEYYAQFISDLFTDELPEQILNK